VSKTFIKSNKVTKTEKVKGIMKHTKRERERESERERDSVRPL